MHEHARNFVSDAFFVGHYPTPKNKVLEHRKELRKYLRA